jgi:phage-related protein
MDEKPIEWMGSSYRDLIEMPERVQDEIGYTLDLAQHGMQARYAKQLHGDLANVIEILVNHDKRAFRGAYTVKLGDTVYVLDVFVKKSMQGSTTPERDLDRIRGRYRLAKEHHEEQRRKERKG